MDYIKIVITNKRGFQMEKKMTPSSEDYLEAILML